LPGEIAGVHRVEIKAYIDGKDQESRRENPLFREKFSFNVIFLG